MMTTYKDDYELRVKRSKIEQEQKWFDEIPKIPFIQFKENWLVQVIPPFGDAVVRFRVKLPSGLEKSVYLDSRGSIGYYFDDANQLVTYWEVYPYHGDVGRCLEADVASLLAMISDETEGE